MESKGKIESRHALPSAPLLPCSLEASPVRVPVSFAAVAQWGAVEAAEHDNKCERVSGNRNVIISIF